MNPLRWIRWKVVGTLAVLGLVFYFLGLDKLALSQLNSAGGSSRAARWAVDDLALALLGGSADFKNLIVGTPDKKAAQEGAASDGQSVAEKVFNAAEVKVDLSMGSLLSRRLVVDQVLLGAPKMTVARREDGSTNVGDLGEAPNDETPETTEPPGDPRDWVETIRKWVDRLQKVREKIPERKPKDEGAKAPWSVDYSRGVSYPFEGRPAVEVREIVTRNLEVSFDDATSSEPLPALAEGRLTIRNLSSSPGVQKEPTQFSLTANLGGVQDAVGITGTIDFRDGKSIFDLKAELRNLPADLVQAFVGSSLPVDLKSGTISVSTDLFLDGAETLRLEPKLGFRDLKLEPKDPNGKVAGLNAQKFATAFNQASGELGELEIADLKITGSLASPKFEWGDTVQNLVVSGAKAFAQKKAGEQLDRAREKLDELPIPKEAAGLKNALQGVDTKNFTKQAGDIEKSAGGLLQGVLGGKKKTEEGGTK